MLIEQIIEVELRGSGPPGRTCGTITGYNMHRAGQRCFKLLALIGSPQLLQQSYFPAGQDSWPNWTNLKGLHCGRGFVGNKQFFTCGSKKKKTSEKIAEPLY